MKKLSTFILLYLLSNLLLGQATNEENFISFEAKLTYFKKVVDSLRVSSNNPGLAISIIHNNENIYKESLGFRNVSKKLAVTNHTIFHTGSLAKAMTGFIAAHLVDEGKMEWLDPVKKHLEEFEMANEYTTNNVTIKDLLTHHTGLAQHYYMMYGPPFERNDIIEFLPHMGLGSSLREKYQYNNFTYTIAGIVEERITGQSWEDLVQTRIFNPLEMDDSYSNYIDIIGLKDVAVSYNRDGVTVVPEKDVESASTNFGPAGGLYSSIEDMTKWLMFLINDGIINGDTLISAKQFSYITDPLVPRYPKENRFYGIGWDVTTNKKHHTVSHNGVTAGQKSRLFFIPDSDFGVAVLCNQYSDLPSALTLFAEEIFIYGNKPDISFALDHFRAQAEDKKNKLPLEEYEISDHKILNKLKAFSGEYLHPAYGVIKVSNKEPKRLGFQYYDFIGTMEHHDSFNFTAHTTHTTGKDEFPSTFIFDNDGKVIGMEVKFPASPKMFFQKN